MYQKYIKRFLDILVSGSILLVGCLPLLFIALLVRIKLGSPVLFTQTRSGKDERLFTMYKFRSMTNEKDTYGNLLPDKDRLTKFGKLIRSLSIDELPEIINIFKGDMSFVGPRPLSLLYLPDYTADSRRRHEVRPGLTGYAQVNGRNNLPWNDRFKLDVKYVEDHSFIMDLKILFMTVKKVLCRSDITLRGTKDYTLCRMLEEEGVTKMQQKEIGSHFHMGTDIVPEGMNPDKLDLQWLPKGDDYCLTLSGRAAIGIALRNIKAKKEVKTAYLPSYCCLSMIQPFYDAGFRVEFYDVKNENGNVAYEIDTNKNCDVFLAMSYFGLSATVSDDILASFRKKGIIIIEDVTHRIMSAQPVSSEADYAVMSLRKWFAVPAGGCLISFCGKLSSEVTEDSAGAMDKKIAAMCEKRDYLNGKEVSKEDFLNNFYAGDRVLQKAKYELKLDTVSAAILDNTDVEAVRNRRIDNAKIIYKRLQELPVKALVEAPDWEKCCPLFVPVLIPAEERDALRKYLIDNGIYCPVHWPEVMGTTVGLRANEMSLICDQRYTAENMEYMMDCISKFYVENK